MLLRLVAYAVDLDLNNPHVDHHAAWLVQVYIQHGELVQKRDNTLVCLEGA